MKKNILIIHGGGPTPVINCSLYGVIKESYKHSEIDKIYGSIGGVEGILNDKLIDFKEIPEQQIELLKSTPGSAIGSSRYPITEEDYTKMVEKFKEYNIGYVLVNGGNGTMETCHKISQLCDDSIKVIGIPKTIDNDIMNIDHAPGFPSAAKYVANTVKEIGYDVKGLPIHVSVVETMGRNAGYITAASVLAREKKGDAPHLIYLPEKIFDMEAFLKDVRKLYDELGGVVVVVSEGLKGKDNQPIVPPIFKTDRATYYGDVGSYLAETIIKELGIKARSEKVGIAGRASIELRSNLDVIEATKVGEKAVEAAIEGYTGVMIGITRDDNDKYPYIPISQVSLDERLFPEEYITGNNNDISDDYADWLRPLIDGDPRVMISFNNRYDN